MAGRRAEHEQRLPGTLAEVRGSEKGPHIGAFFDLDGTLVAGFTAAAMTKEQQRAGKVSRLDLLRSLGPVLQFARGALDFADMLQLSTASMAGTPVAEIDDLAERVFSRRVKDLVYPEMRRLVQAHLDQGHTVVLASSALRLQVQPVADHLGISHVLCNELEVEDGVVTGGVRQPVIWGTGKSRAVQEFAAARDIALSDSYFYADGDEDTALMYLVGRPRPTNPRSGLRAVAERRGWPVLDFSSRGAGGLGYRVKQLYGLGSMGAYAASSMAVGVARQDKRAGINVLLRNYPRMLLRLNGVELNISGAENLENARPAIFVFNHRTNIDSFIAASLIAHDYTGVAKKELEKDPFMGPVGKFMDVAFLDRSNTAAALAELKKVEDLARRGLSILVAPEGTRIDTTSVGSFKKGAFRMAMAAGVPVVPIIIRNAEDVAGPDSHTFNPGVVDVHVGEPVDTSDWQVGTLDEHIAAVREVYLQRLADWPGRPAPMTDPAGRTPARKPAKKATATKATAKKATAKKATSTKAPAKKATSTKAPVKKTAAGTTTGTSASPSPARSTVANPAAEGETVVTKAVPTPEAPGSTSRPTQD